MYQIIERLDGTFDCSYRVQDGTEYFQSKTLGEAVRSMIQAARFGCGNTITASDISYLQERETVIPARYVTACEPFTPSFSASPPADDVGPSKYPRGLKGLLMRIADEL